MPTLIIGVDFNGLTIKNKDNEKTIRTDHQSSHNNKISKT